MSFAANHLSVNYMVMTPMKVKLRKWLFGTHGMTHVSKGIVMNLLAYGYMLNYIVVLLALKKMSTIIVEYKHDSTTIQEFYLVKKI